MNEGPANLGAGPAAGLLPPARSYNLYYVYADSDEEHLAGLERHLRLLERQQLVRGWHRRKLLPGEDWQSTVDQQFASADVILLLVSPSFLDSKYCYDTEVERAMRRHEQGEAVVVPIIVRPCMWDLAPFARCKPLPRNEEPVVLWDEQDSAFLDIAQGIHELLLSLQGSDRGRVPLTEHTPRTSMRFGVRECVDRLETLLATLPTVTNDLAKANELRTNIGALDQFIRPLLTPRAGEIIGGMELIQPVGSGAFATVWLSKKPRSDGKELFATKVLHATCLTSGSMLWRFRRGVKAMKYLTRKKDAHPHIVPFLHEDESSLAFTMPFFPGQNLVNVRERGWAIDKKVEVLIAICGAVEYAHKKGVVHRDIKPANIVFDARGEPILTDFDIADMDYATTISMNERGLGSPMFAAPEQIENSEKSDVRLDVYSIGRLMHYLLVEGPISVIPEHPEDFKALSKCPGPLIAIVRKATRRLPSKRFPDVASLRLALANYRSRWSVFSAWVYRIRPGAALAALVLLGLAIALIVAVFFGEYGKLRRSYALLLDSYNEQAAELSRLQGERAAFGDKERELDREMEDLVRLYHEEEQRAPLDPAGEAEHNSKLLDAWRDLDARKRELRKGAAELVEEFRRKRAILEENRRQLEEHQKKVARSTPILGSGLGRPLLALAPIPTVAPEAPPPPDSGSPPPSVPDRSLTFGDLWPQLDAGLAEAQRRCAAPAGSGARLKLTLAVTVHPSGESSARMLPGPRARRTGACIAGILQAIRVHAFTGHDFLFNRTVEINSED